MVVVVSGIIVQDIIQETDDDAFEAAFLRELMEEEPAGRIAKTEAWVTRHPARAALWRTILEEVTNEAQLLSSGIKAVGPYQISSWLASGGQGDVFVGTDTRLGRPVVVKALRYRTFDQAMAYERVYREASAAARLNHPSICPIYDILEEDGTTYLIMKYVPGESLAAILTRWRADKELQPGAPASHRHRLKQVVTWIQELSEALHVTHIAGILHRDIKPSNVIIDPDGTAVLIDFGAALLLDENSNAETVTGNIVGTPLYLSPDQLTLSRSELDGRSDVYALGVLLYECCTLVHPHEQATQHSIIQAIEHEQPTDPRRIMGEIGPDLRAVILTAMEKDRELRYASAKALADDLRSVSSGLPVRARAPSTWRQLAAWTARNRAIAASVAAALVVLLAGFLVSLSYYHRSEARLSEWQQLADVIRADSLVAEAEDVLWPVSSQSIENLERFMRHARDLMTRVPRHREIIEELIQRASGATAAIDHSSESVEPSTQKFDRPEEQFQYDQMMKLDRATRRLSKLVEENGTWIDSIPQRLIQAQNLHKLTVEDHRAAWGLVAQRVRISGPYDQGFQVVPQEGLIPIGPDPSSKFEEFAVALSGDVPTRDTSGNLRIDGNSAIVLVLLPGGLSMQGAQNDEVGKPHFDPHALRTEGPVHDVVIAPFFMGKYEISQGQWLRIFGANPSAYQPNSTPRGIIVSLRNPVEQVSQDEASRGLRRLSLVLPSEAQWEYSCRSGSHAPYSTGDDPHSLSGFANIADAGSVPYYVAGWNHLPDFDDGHGAHAPIGSFLPNAFGLHDFHGNVMEWCRDPYSELRSGEVGSGDLVRHASETQTRSIRGGSFQLFPNFARSSFRSGMSPTDTGSDVGFRAARDYVPVSSDVRGK
jgi:serine/threonine protein kinase/formylglycine-generating enzyme required for sulfatase activity